MIPKKDEGYFLIQNQEQSTYAVSYTHLENALRAVPKSYREASLGLGATPIRTIFKVTIPAARSGILSGVILGVGRAIGETMAVIMVAGNVANMPTLLGTTRFLTTGIAMEMSYA